MCTKRPFLSADEPFRIFRAIFVTTMQPWAPAAGWLDRRLLHRGQMQLWWMMGNGTGPLWCQARHRFSMLLGLSSSRGQGTPPSDNGRLIWLPI